MTNQSSKADALIIALRPSPNGFGLPCCSGGNVANNALLMPSTSVFRPSSFCLSLPPSTTFPVTTTVFIDPISFTSVASESMNRKASTLCGIVTAAPPNVGDRKSFWTERSLNLGVSCRR